MADDELLKGNWKTKSLKFTWTIIQQIVPITNWLRYYKWKQNLVLDCCAGFTFACMSVPQGLAFSVLANCPVQYGLYTACFPAFIYSLFGMAHVSSFGSVAIGSMLTGEAVESYVPEPLKHLNESLPFVSTVTFLVGLSYLVLSAVRMGVVVGMFRKPFVSGYIAACSCHILIKSAKLLLGVDCETYYGVLNFYFNAAILCENIHKTSVPTVIIAAICIAILLFNMLWFKDWFLRRVKYPIPIEGLVLVLFICLSYFFNFKNMGVKIVGSIPTGLPYVIPPSIKLMYPAFPHAVSIGVINFAQSISMILLYNDEVYPNQEALALALSDLICSSFQCMTIGNSLMRTAIAVNIGVKTLLATTICSLFMLIVILFAGPLFAPLPECILGCIIFSSTGKLVYDRFRELPSSFRASTESGCIWIVTFVVSIVATMQIGLIVGLSLCLKQILNEMKVKENEERRRTENRSEGEALNVTETKGKRW